MNIASKQLDYKIIIGTANFGSKYGTEKLSKLFPVSDLENIFEDIRKNSNIFIDTASTYINSELLIGKIAPFSLEKRIITKIIISPHDTFFSVVGKIEKSLENIKQNTLYSVLIHNASFINFTNINEIIRGLKHCQDIGITNNIGVSCYDASEIINIKKRFSLLTNFQLPENVVDRRNFKNQNLIDLKLDSNEIYLRSIFLQGTLLSGLNQLPNALYPSKKIFENLEIFCKENNISKLKYCLDYARSIGWNSGMVFGIQNFNQYKEILKELERPITVHNFPTEVLDTVSVDPRNWTYEE